MLSDMLQAFDKDLGQYIEDPLHSEYYGETAIGEQIETVLEEISVLLLALKTGKVFKTVYCNCDKAIL